MLPRVHGEEAEAVKKALEEDVPLVEDPRQQQQGGSPAVTRDQEEDSRRE